MGRKSKEKKLDEMNVNRFHCPEREGRHTNLQTRPSLNARGMDFLSNENSRKEKEKRLGGRSVFKKTVQATNWSPGGDIKKLIGEPWSRSTAQIQVRRKNRD